MSAPEGRCPTCGRGVGAELRWETQCKATSKHTGERCSAWAISGTDLCRVHGGMAEQTRRRGEVRMIEAQAQIEAAQRRLAGEEWWEPQSQAEVLESRSHDADARVTALRRRVEEDPSPAADEAFHKWVTTSAMIAKACLDHGVAERLVAIRERQGQQLASGLGWLFDGLGLDELQRGRVPVLVPAMFRALGSGSELPDAGELLRGSGEWPLAIPGALESGGSS